MTLALNPLRSTYLLWLSLLFWAGSGLAQTANLSGTVNHYAAVEIVHAEESNDVDSVTVAGLPPAFGVGDTVMVHWVRGTTIEQTDIEGEEKIGKVRNPRNAGKYAFMIIDAIDGNTVTFNTSFNSPSITEIAPLAQGEMVQLIRVPSYYAAEVTGTLTAPDWDPVSGTGGVVALFVTTTLSLNADIDVSSRGFLGAGPGAQEYDGTCSVTDTVLYGNYFYDLSDVKAGIKGEGINDTVFSLLRGKGRNVTGGGGGNGKYSGGGGGSNASSGGKGGRESTDCAPGVDAPGGDGGYALNRAGDSYYWNFDDPLLPPQVERRWNRIFFGGGGGTGTRMTGRVTTSGGDGGGLVVIVADTIAGNGNFIRADGESVTATATGAGGGGGAGGGIILDVSGYRNTLRLSASGGMGGNTNHPSDVTGPGGGGGGGAFWLAGTSQPNVDPVSNIRGEGGAHTPTSDNHGATDGGLPLLKYGLEAPLRGFLFNSVPSEFTVCSDQVPETIRASEPKGGSGSYNYQWVDSSATQNQWLPIAGATGKDLVFAGPLSDTTYFRRVVTSGPLDPDTSFRIAVYVHPAITGNAITAADTVCTGNAPQPFLPAGSPGGGLGNGTYTYLWLKDEAGDGSYQTADGSSNGEGYAAPALTATTRFTRVTYSGVCIDTASPLTVTVFESLTGNTIASNDTICWNTRPDLISGPEPGQGDPSDKRYRWESSSSETGPWSSEGFSGREYRPGPLQETTWFRRVALSGSDDACVDFSDAVEVLTIDTISNNTILTPEQTVCRNTFQPEPLQGSDPGGGYQGLYSWRWESRTLSTGWVTASGVSNQKSYEPPVMTGDTTWYRRVTGSGGAARNVCTDVSDSIAVHVLPPITNNEVLPASDVLCQFDRLGELTQDPAGGPAPGGGATQGGTDPTRSYRWEVANDEGGPWTELSDGPGEIAYSERPVLDLEEDYRYRRIVQSGPLMDARNQVCRDTSEQIRVTIHTAIGSNALESADSACFSSEKTLAGETPTGEEGLPPSFSWLDASTGDPIPGSDMEDLVFDVSGTGPYRFLRSVTIGVCTDTSDVMEVTVMRLPGGILSADLAFACEKDTLLQVDLNIDTLDNYVTPWEIYLSDGVRPSPVGPLLLEADGSVQVTLETEPSEADSTEFTYRLDSIVYRSVTDRYACVSPPGNLTGSVPIEVFRRPDPVITVEGTPRDSFKVCNTTMNLLADADNGSGSWTSQPSGVFFTYDPGSGQTLASIPNDSIAFREYALTFTSLAGDCAGRDTLAAHFFEQPAPAFAGEDTMIFLINSLQLRADPPTAGIGTWSYEGDGPVSFEDVHDPKTWVYGLEVGVEYDFVWEIVNGEDEGTCLERQDVSIVIRNEVKRYEGFSPNGDDYNEYYIMQGLQYADEFTIKFFNSLGRVVRTVTRESAGELQVDPSLIPGGIKEDELVVWDGLADNGNPVPSGTYYYVVDFFVNQTNPLSGEVIDTDMYTYKDYVVVARD